MHMGTQPASISVVVPEIGTLLLALLAPLLILLFGGGGLLLVGRRFIARQPGATYGESVVAVVVGIVTTVPAQAFIYHIASWLMGGRTAACLVAGLLAFLAGVLIFVLTIKATCGLGFAKAFLAWLPLLAVQVIQAGLVALVLLVLQYALNLSGQANCTSSLAAMSRATAAYKAQHDGNWPADLRSLRTVKVDDTQTESFLCPCFRREHRKAGRTYDYFYCPPRPDAGPRTIVACDFGNNHGDESRNVLRADGTFGPMSDGEFQAEMAKPENKAFAAALLQAEAEAGRTLPSGD
jgi:hypothetical protein